MQLLLDHVNPIKLSIQFTTQNVKDNQLASLNHLKALMVYGYMTSVFGKLSFTGRYLSFDAQHPFSAVGGLISA